MDEGTGIEDVNGAFVNYGDKVEFTYNGSQDEFAGQKFMGLIVPAPQVNFAHGAVPLEGGWALEVEIRHPEAE